MTCTVGNKNCSVSILNSISLSPTSAPPRFRRTNVVAKPSSSSMRPSCLFFGHSYYHPVDNQVVDSLKGTPRVRFGDLKFSHAVRQIAVVNTLGSDSVAANSAYFRPRRREHREHGWSQRARRLVGGRADEPTKHALGVSVALIIHTAGHGVWRTKRLRA